jgi:DNA-binding CsgD family transcriptional regulator
MLVGRHAETEAVDHLLAAARGGESSVIALRGEAGIGKSALLDYAAEHAAGMTVLRGAGVEAESGLGFAALHQVLRPLLERVDNLPAPQAAALRSAFALSAERVDDRFRVSLAVLSLLADAAEERPLVCLVDDAQWLDHASADALLFAARRLEADPIALLFAARDDERRPFSAPGVQDLRLDALAPADARMLLTVRLGSESSKEAVDWLLENANGNPLALIELPALLSAAQLTGRDAIDGALPPPTSVEDAYLERVRALPHATQTLLLAAAAESTGDRATIVRAAAALDVEPIALTDAEAADLVRVDRDHVEFRHPLVRSAVYRAASFAAREQIHRALAAALDRPDDADRRAWHRAAATVGPDAEVADELEQSAERAARRSGHAAAAAALRRAAELSVDTEAEARRLVAAAGAAWRAGHPEQATRLLDWASPLVTDDRLRVDVQHMRGQIELRCGVQTEACDILMAGAEEIARTDSHKALEMLLEAREAAGWAGDTPRTIAAGERAAALPRPEDPDYRFLADLLVGVGKMYTGETAIGIALVEDVVARADEIENAIWLMWAASGARGLGQEDREAALMRRAVANARADGSIDSLTYVLLSSSLMGLLGAEPAAAAHAGEGVTLAREAGLPNATSTHLAMLAWFDALRGAADACRSHAREALELAQPRGVAAATSIAEWALGLLALGEGRVDEAASHLATAASPQPGVGHPYFALTSAPDRVEACVRSERRDEAAEATAIFDAFAAPGSPPWARALAARCHALTGRAEEAFDEALALHADGERPYDRARTQLLYGEHLRRQRQRRESREHLRAALATFESLGAAPWAERARTELRASGETARKRDPSTLSQLTPQELQIARLVGDGHSNKEVAAQLFLSPRTIDYHLRKVFTKLEITSRTELIKLGLGEQVPA